MKKIERLSLLDQIGRELQSRMSYSDIDTYLSGFGVEVKGKKPSVNSKWVYVKEVLANEPEKVVVEIADELEIDHTVSTLNRLAEPSFWKPNHFRLFLCHLSSFKEKTAQLQRTLIKYGISGFVAHEDIEPTKEWQIEIEKALFSMDALVAILIQGFRESNWADQEIGVAIGRNVLVIPIRRGLDPYGFLGKYQGLSAGGKSVQEVAKSIYDILITHQKTKQKMITCLINLLLQSASASDARGRIRLIKEIESLSDSHIRLLREQALSNQVINSNILLQGEINVVLKANGAEPLISKTAEVYDDDIPF